MGPWQANMTCLRKYATFGGRASRSEFWWFALASGTLLFTLGFAIATLYQAELYTARDVLDFIGMLAGLAVVLPLFAVSARRLHDIGLSTWFALAFLSAFVATRLGFETYRTARYGPWDDIKDYQFGLMLFDKNELIEITLTWAIFLVFAVMCIRPSQPGPQHLRSQPTRGDAMTDQSPNDIFKASSFLQGHNAEYIEQLYARYANDPNAVDEAWQAFFKELGDAGQDAQAEAAGPSWARADWPPAPSDELTAALDGQWGDLGPAAAEMAAAKIETKAAEKGVEVTDNQIKRAVLDSIRALMIIRAYRIRGHLVADLDPLGSRDETKHPELAPKSYGFTDADMDRPIFIDNVLGLEMASMREILAIVNRTYCGTFALQYMHISNPIEAGWLKERIEGYGKEIGFSREGRKAILNKLVEAEGFEKFLHVKYMGTKRFGLDGGESLIPAMGANHQTRVVLWACAISFLACHTGDA